jgi:hypothetical protein
MLLAVWAPAASEVSAQEISGRVTGISGTPPVPGALVLVVNEADEQVTGVLTDEAGMFVIRTVAAGRYRLVSRRIGYADGESEWFDHGAGTPRTFHLELPRRAIAIEGITAEPDRRCRTIEPGDASTIAQFWEEARKALEITRFTESSGDLEYASITFDRYRRASNLTVLSEDTEPHSGIGVMPFESAPPDSLALLGYIQGDARNGREYFAPDAQTLLSTEFMNTHCLRFHEASSARDSVGIRIEPVTGRTLPDIQGVLWLDGESLKLRRLDFSYVNAELEVEAEHIGGHVGFEELSNGAWIVSDWTIRMPSIEARRGPRQTVTFRLRGYQEVGGQVIELADLSGQSLLRSR